MKKTLLVVNFICVLFTSVNAQETRGTWMSRNSFTSRANIARQMDSLAQNNFNVVFVDMWTRGYPLWQSSVFASHTGVFIDPIYAGRDILAECIAEGHRVGLQVEAWFEYGFVGGWTGNVPPGSKGPIMDAHPDWVSQQQNGTEIDGNNFYWMIQAKPECQNFLIDLAKEIAQNYDVDGIEMDRIRYSSLYYGYDPFTVSLYQSEHSGTPPPVNVSDAVWMQWRASKLNSFVGRIYDSLKVVNPSIKVSNAPSQYSSTAYTSYNSFCQDWKTWVNNGDVDHIEIQMYVTSPTSFGDYIQYVKNSLSVANFKKVNACFAINPGGTPLTNSVILQMIDKVRSKKAKGTVIWFYDDLETRMQYIKTNRFTTFNYPYYSTLNWRKWFKITPVTNTTDAVRTGTWSNSSLPGYNGGASIFADNVGTNFVEYYATVPQTAWYEVYAYQVTYSNRAPAAEHTIYDYNNAATVSYINQTNSLNNGFVKLGNVYLTSGRRKILKISNAGLTSGQYVSADGMMIVLNRKLSPTIALREALTNDKPVSTTSLRIIPNPANNHITVFGTESDFPTEVKIYNVTGAIVYSGIHPGKLAEINIDLGNIIPGVYIVSWTSGNEIMQKKFIKQ